MTKKHSKLKRYLILSLGTLILISPTINAQARHHYMYHHQMRYSQMYVRKNHRHYHTKRRLHHQNRYLTKMYGYNLSIHSHKMNHNLIHYNKKLGKYTPKNQKAVDFYTKQFSKRTFQDINYERQKHGLRKLKINPVMNKLANVRAKQIKSNFSHTNKYGLPYNTLDAFHYGMQKYANRGINENIGEALLGHNKQKYDSTPYYCQNGKQMADEDENTMMRHDKFDHNGHRKNILSHSQSIGISISYNRKNGDFYIAEEFYINHHFHLL